VEQVRPVRVHLDASLRISFTVRVPADVVSSIHNEYRQPELVGRTFGDCEPKEAGTHNNQICHENSDA
jgi:hypothetical protein